MSDTNVSNVVPLDAFRKAKARKERSSNSEWASEPGTPPEAESEEATQEAPQKRSLVVATLLFLVLLVRAVLYGLMLWLRGPIKVVLWLAAATMWIGVPMMYFGMSDYPEQAMMVTWGLSVGIGATLLRLAYDPLLAFISPR